MINSENINYSFFIQVPLNQKGIEEWNCCLAEFNNMEHFEFNEHETTFLDNLFRRFNKKFDIMIDEWEDEEMSAEHIPDALTMARHFADEISNEAMRPAVNRLITALELALQLKMPVYFDF